MKKSSNRPPAHVAILGAGPAGLAVGHELTANGTKVTVLDRNDFVGGLCRTLDEDGYKFDLGGHRWFTKNEDLNNWFRRLMEGEIVMVDRISRIFHGGKFFNYPISFGDIIKNTGPITVLHAGFSFLLSILMQAIRPKTIANMRDAYTVQFGAKLYNMFFRQYSEKVWGLPCEKLSADWVTQRSKGLSIWSLVRNAVIKSNAPVSLIDEFMYPRDGYMRIPERMAEDIVECGSEVRLGSTVNRIVYHGPGDFEVFYEADGGQDSVRTEAVVSTIPLGILARILQPGCDESVEKAANSLEFRDLITVNVRLKRRQVTRDTWLYIQDKDILFGRMHEPKNWSPAMVPDDEHTSLVLECFCTRGDHIWQLSDDDITARCIRDLVDKLHFIDDREVVGAQVVRTIQAYPVYDLAYQANITVVKDYLSRHEGLHMVGRGGTFRYNNADHSIEMGLLLGRRLLGEDVDYMAVNTETEYHEEVRANQPKRDYYRADTEKSQEKVTAEPSGTD
jgi:protoporphyrinogen oxidase